MIVEAGGQDFIEFSDSLIRMTNGGTEPVGLSIQIGLLRLSVFIFMSGVGPWAQIAECLVRNTSAL